MTNLWKEPDLSQHCSPCGSNHSDAYRDGAVYGSVLKVCTNPQRTMSKMGIVNILLSKASGCPGVQAEARHLLLHNPLQQGKICWTTRAEMPFICYCSFLRLSFLLLSLYFPSLSVFSPAQFYLLPSAALAAPPVDSPSSAVPTLYHSEYGLSLLERVFTFGSQVLKKHHETRGSSSPCRPFGTGEHTQQSYRSTTRRSALQRELPVWHTVVEIEINNFSAQFYWSRKSQ